MEDKLVLGFLSSVFVVVNRFGVAQQQLLGRGLSCFSALGVFSFCLLVVEAATTRKSEKRRDSRSRKNVKTKKTK